MAWQDFSYLPAEARKIAEVLQLEPLEHEGGLFRNNLATSDSSAIYYMLCGDDFSALHYLAETEVYHWYAGSPLHIVQLNADGSGIEHILGPDITAGQRPQIVIPGGCFHGSYPLGRWSLVGTTMAPPFNWETFKLGSRSELLASHPNFRQQILRLTR